MPVVEEAWRRHHRKAMPTSFSFFPQSVGLLVPTVFTLLASPPQSWTTPRSSATTSGADRVPKGHQPLATRASGWNLSASIESRRDASPLPPAQAGGRSAPCPSPEETPAHCHPRKRVERQRLGRVPKGRKPIATRASGWKTAPRSSPEGTPARCHPRKRVAGRALIKSRRDASPLPPGASGWNLSASPKPCKGDSPSRAPPPVLMRQITSARTNALARASAP